MLNENNPVMLDGKIKNFFLIIDGHTYYCECGCNVFHKPNMAYPKKYKCNACNKTFEAE